MSNKNLKVYKMQFITQVRKLTMNVKFSCKMKMTWKRSNECAESTWVPLQAGCANFDQTLKLQVNMYFDTTTNKFVQKKCLYSFVISTDKGQKSAGTITIDLAEFFNKRIYDMEKEFSIEKCPVAGTKIQMKIYYEEDATEQAGYDSMSCISATNPMDSSVASVDFRDLAPTKSNISQKEEQTQKSSDLSSSKAEESREKQQEKYLNLDVSDVMQSPKKKIHSDGTKIGENIKSINTLTTKINQFVTDKSKNIKYQIEGFKRRINTLEEQVQGEKMAREKVEKQLNEEKRKNGEIQKEYSDFKVDVEHKMDIEGKKNQQLQNKYKNSQQMLEQLQTKMSESGSSQSSYIQQLKDNHKDAQEKFNEEVQELRSTLVQEKKQKNDLKVKVEQLEITLKDVRERLESAVQRNQTMENDMRRKEEEIEMTRVNLERGFQNLVNSLNSVL